MYYIFILYHLLILYYLCIDLLSMFYRVADRCFCGNMEGKEGKMLESKGIEGITKLLFFCYAMVKFNHFTKTRSI